MKNDKLPGWAKLLVALAFIINVIFVVIFILLVAFTVESDNDEYGYDPASNIGIYEKY